MRAGITNPLRTPRPEPARDFMRSHMPGDFLIRPPVRDECPADDFSQDIDGDGVLCFHGLSFRYLFHLAKGLYFAPSVTGTLATISAGSRRVIDSITETGK